MWNNDSRRVTCNAANLQNTKENLHLLKALQMSLTLVKDVKALVSKIVKLNGKIASLRREHNLDRKIIAKG